MTIDEIKKLCKDNEYLFSGSITFKESTYLFNFVNGDAMLYIVDEIKEKNEEGKIEVRTHAKDTKNIQQQSFDPPEFVGL